MELSEELLAGLDVAVNEAEFCDMRINERTGEVRLLLLLLSLPEEGPEPSDRRSVFSLTGVSRIVASLRGDAAGDDRGGRSRASRRSGRAGRSSASGASDRDVGRGRFDQVVPLMLEELPSTVRSFGCQPVYGWDFFDLPDQARTLWRERASLDFPVGQGRGKHSIDLFQEGVAGDPRRLDLRIEFDELSVKNARGRAVPLGEVVASGRRWWAALQAGDPRVAGHGITLGAPTRGDASAGDREEGDGSTRGYLA
jgi:hypothetical protein